MTSAASSSQYDALSDPISPTHRLVYGGDFYGTVDTYSSSDTDTSPAPCTDTYSSSDTDTSSSSSDTDTSSSSSDYSSGSSGSDC